MVIIFIVLFSKVAVVKGIPLFKNIKDAITTYLEMIAEETEGSIYEAEVNV